MTWRTFVATGALVFVGGAIGTFARAILTLQVDASGGPWLLLSINVVGAGLLGIVVGSTHTRFTAHTRRTHAFVSVGLLGGFTSYSALAVDTIALSLTTAPWLAVVYVTATLGGGFAASLIGIAAGSVIRSPGKTS